MIRQYEQEFVALRNSGLPGAAHFYHEINRLKRLYAVTLDSPATMRELNAAVYKELLKISTGYIMLEGFYAELPN